MKTGKFLAAASALTLAAVSYANTETMDVSATCVCIYDAIAELENNEFYLEEGEKLTQDMLIENGLKVQMRKGYYHDMLEDPLYGEITLAGEEYEECTDYSILFPVKISEGENIIYISASYYYGYISGASTQIIVNVHISSSETTTYQTDISETELILPEAALNGDATNDGKVDIRDVTAIAQHIVKMRFLDEQGIANSDVVNDGIIDVKDLAELKKMLIS